MPSLDGAMENPQDSFCVGNGSANLYVQGAHSNCPSAGKEKGNPPLFLLTRTSPLQSPPHTFSNYFVLLVEKAFRAAGAHERDPHFCKGTNPFHLGRKDEEENPSHSLRARCPGHSGRSGAQPGSLLFLARVEGRPWLLGKKGKALPSLSLLFPSLLKRSLTIFW